MRRSNSAITSSGKPFGYTGSAFSLSTPAISQWPVVVSFPLEPSSSRAKLAKGASARRPHTTPSMLNRPSFCSVGVWYLGLFTIAPSVLLPTSPKRAASGISPMPKLSSTMINTCFAIIFSPLGGAFFCFAVLVRHFIEFASAPTVYQNLYGMLSLPPLHADGICV